MMTKGGVPVKFDTSQGKILITIGNSVLSTEDVLVIAHKVEHMLMDMAGVQK